MVSRLFMRQTNYTGRFCYNYETFRSDYMYACSLISYVVMSSLPPMFRQHPCSPSNRTRKETVLMFEEFLKERERDHISGCLVGNGLELKLK